MKNPCDECLIKVNCTAICFDKTNYRQLIMNAIQQNSGRQPYNRYKKTYVNYIKLLTATNEDERDIIHRATMKSMGN